MIYLDSPAGVGLSYSNEKSDYITGDNQTAHDAQDFLREFFRRFPSFLDNDFYISGGMNDP
jgi:serine carboxypeptidase-like clade 1